MLRFEWLQYSPGKFARQKVYLISNLICLLMSVESYNYYDKQVVKLRWKYTKQ